MSSVKSTIQLKPNRIELTYLENYSGISKMMMHVRCVFKYYSVYICLEKANFSVKCAQD